MLFILEYSQGLCCSLWDDSARGNEMGSLCYKISSTGNGPASVKTWFLQILDAANLPEVYISFPKKKPSRDSILMWKDNWLLYFPLFHVVQNTSSHKGFLSDMILLREDHSFQAFILITLFILNTEGELLFVYLGGHSEKFIARGTMPGRDEWTQSFVTTVYN